MANPKIDYYLRPAKYIERILLSKTLRKLSSFNSIQSYRYIGFGAKYFRDFKLFHKDLGITNMISIERDISSPERYEFNKPFRCIKMEYGSASSVLPRLPWLNIPTIAWLDYVDPLNAEVLADITFFISNAEPGSYLLITVNCESGSLRDYCDCKKSYIDVLTERIGSTNIPLGLKNKDLAGMGTATKYGEIIRNKINKILGIRNGTLPEGNTIEFSQLNNFVYSDGAHMLTIGGLIYRRSQKSIYSFCQFEELSHTRLGEEYFNVQVPAITLKEANYLESYFPTSEIEIVPTNGIPKTEIQKYSEIYKYYPQFVSGEL